MLILGLHADFAAGLNHRWNLVNFVLTNKIADGGVGDHDFAGHYPPLVFSGHQGLRDDRLNRFRQH